VFEYGFQRRDVAAVVGLAGYHLYDLAIQVRYPIRGRLGTREADLVDLETTIRARQRDEIVSRLFGVAQGRNVILVNAESLQAFTIGLLVKGQPVTPNLTAFAKESLHFTEFYDQTHMGTTSDAEYITLNSLMALPSGSVATRYGANGFCALPYVLTERGYRTLSACAEPPSFWNMRQMHARYGFARSLFLPDFRMGEWMNVGLDDASFFDQMVPVLAEQPSPFFAFMLTSSNHHPYQLPAELRRLGHDSLPSLMAGDYLQSVRHFDEAFGEFIRRSASSGLLDRSVVVLYGDHQSWVEDADLQGLWLSAGHSSPATPFELWRFRRKIPLLIRLPGGAEAGPRDIAGGHLDITPTLLSLLGVPGPTGPWLGRDLTAPRRGVVVFRDGSVTDSQTTALAGLGGTARCYGPTGQPLPCEALAETRDEGRVLLYTADRMIAGNLATAVTGRLKTGAQSAPRKPGPVLVIAHRGDSIHYPENTLASIRSAFDVGADVVEVDVRLSKDGVPMVFHDEDVDRTSDGHGPFAALALREVKALDVGMWQHPRFAGVRVPTLEEALLEARGRGRLYLDLAVDGLSGPIARTFARLGVSPQEALVATWTSDQRAEFARDMPGARLVRVERAPNAWSGNFFRQLEADGVWGFEIGDERSPAFVGDAARHGVRLLVYTVNDEPTMRRLIEMGVSGIETDDPALLLKVAASLGAR
jgi:glycerophosphoryl diester phosphodiesterase